MAGRPPLCEQPLLRAQPGDLLATRRAEGQVGRRLLVGRRGDRLELIESKVFFVELMVP